MASVTWPAAPFPQVPKVQGYAQREQSAVVRSQMGYGPAKVRRRTTASIEPVNASMTLSGADKDTLRDFYVTDTEGGTLRFNWKDFLEDPDGNGADVEYRFTSPVQWSAQGPDIWLAVMNLEILP